MTAAHDHSQGRAPAKGPVYGRDGLLIGLWRRHKKSTLRTIPLISSSQLPCLIVASSRLASITLGLCGREALPARLGRNAANVFIAAFIGAVAVAYSQKAPFYLAPLFAVLTTIAVLSITARTIDHDKARGLEMEGSHHARIPSGWRVLIRYRLLLVFTAAAALFHFANAPNAAFLRWWPRQDCYS
jgi:hypothetical protein